MHIHIYKRKCVKITTKNGKTHVCCHGWIIWVKQDGSNEMSGREDDPGDAGVPESDRQKSVGHVDEEAGRQSGGEGSTGSKILRPGG